MKKLNEIFFLLVCGVKHGDVIVIASTIDIHMFLPWKAPMCTLFQMELGPTPVAFQIAGSNWQMT